LAHISTPFYKKRSTPLKAYPIFTIHQSSRITRDKAVRQ